MSFTYTIAKLPIDGWQYNFYRALDGARCVVQTGRSLKNLYSPCCGVNVVLSLSGSSILIFQYPELASHV